MEQRSTRDRLLAAGVELMLDHPVGGGLNHVKATEVSRRAGLSHGAFYHHWRSQDDFQDELIEHVLDLGRSVQEVSSFVSRMARIDQDNPVESLRLAMNSSFAEAEAIPWRLWMALVARNDPSVDYRLAKRYRQVSAAYTPEVAAVFHDLGVGVRRPIDVERLVVLIDALWEGLALRNTVAPDLVDDQEAVDEDGGVWSLYALGVAAILLGALHTGSSEHSGLPEAIRAFGLNGRS